MEPLTIWIEQAGLYDLLFTHCSPTPSTVTFTLEASMKNPSGYLSVGEAPLPILFALMAVAFGVALGVWLRYGRSHASELHKIHHIMTLAVFLKAASLGCEAGMYASTNITGVSGGWNIAYYITLLLKGGVLIVVLALVGAGYTLLKPFVSSRERTLIMYALLLQTLSTTAIIITDEWAPGSISYATWMSIFHLADFFAMLLVLCPIIWTISNLRAAQAADGGAHDEKAASTLARLTQFRAFYGGTMAFLYVTRVLLYILDGMLPYDKTWWGPFFNESATLAWYVFTGYKFRPSSEVSVGGGRRGWLQSGNKWRRAFAHPPPHSPERTILQGGGGRCPRRSGGCGARAHRRPTAVQELRAGGGGAGGAPRGGARGGGRGERR